MMFERQTTVIFFDSFEINGRVGISSSVGIAVAAVTRDRCVHYFRGFRYAEIFVVAIGGEEDSHGLVGGEGGGDAAAVPAIVSGTR